MVMRIGRACLISHVGLAVARSFANGEGGNGWVSNFLYWPFRVGLGLLQTASSTLAPLSSRVLTPGVGRVRRLLGMGMLGAWVRERKNMR